MCRFSLTVRLTKGVGKYEEVVAAHYANLWKV